ALLGAENVRFDARKFIYIGSPELSDHGCLMQTKWGVKSVEDAMAKETLMAGNGFSSVPTYMPPLINKLVGTKFKVIEGYKDIPSSYIAMTRGEVYGICAKLDRLAREQAAALKTGEMAMIFNMNEGRAPAFPNMPSIFEYIKKPEDRQLM